MSSIRDALRRAERERQARMQSPSGASAPATPSASPPTPPEAISVPPGESQAGPVAASKVESVPSARAADLRVVDSNVVPLIEVPVDFTEELALFRHGVEAAIPRPRRSLLMTSATSGEGVTMLTVFLATSLAVRDGKKACLVDANFKSPKTSRLFGLLGRPGLSDYCTGRSELGEVLCRTESPDLFLMGLGTDVLNPSLVLSHERARGLAQELSQRFDYVLFDSGSVLGNAETSMLAPTVDGTVLIVRANRTKREVLAKAEKLVRFSGGSVIGTVLNRRSFPIPEAIYKRL